MADNAANADSESELRQHFPHAGYWFRMLPTHPLYHPDETYQFATTNPSAPPAYPPIPPPPGPPPGNQAAPPPCLPQTLTFSIPLNTGVVGGIVTRISLQLPTDILFEDFISRVCARMDLNPADSLLGYKLSGDAIRTPPYNLSNEDELREAITKGIKKTQRARSLEVFIEIHNMVRDSMIWIYSPF
jgi:hypothetical protein